MRLYIKLSGDFMAESGFEQSKVENCLFHKYTTTTEPDGSTTSHCIHLMHHVDDKLIATTPNNPAYDQFIAKFQQRFKVTGGNQVSYFLNMEIPHTPESIQISQRSHIRQIIEACLGGHKTSTETAPLPKDYDPTKLGSPTPEEQAGGTGPASLVIRWHLCQRHPHSLALVSGQGAVQAAVVEV